MKCVADREAKRSEMKAIVLYVNKEKNGFSVANSAALNHCLIYSGGMSEISYFISSDGLNMFCE